MSRTLEKRLEKLEARNAGAEEDPFATLTDGEWAALSHLTHVLRKDARNPCAAPLTDAEWAELQPLLAAGGQP